MAQSSIMVTKSRTKAEGKKTREIYIDVAVPEKKKK